MTSPCSESNTILIVGSNGVIGSSVIKYLKRQSIFFVGTTKRHCNKEGDFLYLDLADHKTFVNLNLNQYKCAILCGSITSIKACEENPLETRKVNVYGNIALIQLLADAGIHVVFISTNLVFDGSLQFPKTTDLVNPINEYARQKLMVEEYLLANVSQSAIIRFSKVLQPSHPLLLEWLRKLNSSERVYPYSNKKIAPVSSHTAASILTWLIKHKKTGLYQASSSTEVSYADVANQLAIMIGSNQSLISPIKTFIGDISASSFSALETSEEITLCFGPLTLQGALDPIIKFYKNQNRQSKFEK